MPPYDNRPASPIPSGSSTRRRCGRSLAKRCAGSWAGKRPLHYSASRVEENLPEADREKFRDMAETELLCLHGGNFARYQIRPSEFEMWEQVWAKESAK